MMPLKIVKEVGHLDPRFFYHVDADYCKRIADLGYRCYYLPTAAIVHLNHKGGTMTSLSARFRSLTMFEVWSYRYYRKHIQKSKWTPMQFIVILGLAFHFLALAFAQTLAELDRVARSGFRPKRPRDPPKLSRGGRRDSLSPRGEGGIRDRPESAQPPPGEQNIGVGAIALRDNRHRRAKLHALGDHPTLRVARPETSSTRASLLPRSSRQFRLHR